MEQSECPRADGQNKECLYLTLFFLSLMEMAFQQPVRGPAGTYKSFLYSKSSPCSWISVHGYPVPVSGTPYEPSAWGLFKGAILVKSESMGSSLDFLLRLKTRELGGIC